MFSRHNKEIVDLLLKHTGELTTHEFALLCNKTPYSIRGIARRAGISLAVDNSYSIQEDIIIGQNIDILSYEDIAKLISTKIRPRSADSVRHRAVELELAGADNEKCLKRSKPISTRFGQKWTVEEDAYVIQILHKKSTYKLVAEQLGRTSESTRARLKVLKRNPKLLALAEKQSNELPAPDHSAPGMGIPRFR